MMIGVDLDNTIVCYDEVMHHAAVERGLVPEGMRASKGAIRDHLRGHGKEDAWIELQGYAYGCGMSEAVPFPGALEFLASCVSRGVPTCIISQRTRHPCHGPRYDLHDAAQEWLEIHGLYDERRVGLGRECVYFELTRQRKLERIARVGCDCFIDDLPELLDELSSQPAVWRTLFDPTSEHAAECTCTRATSWDQIRKLLD